MFKDKKYPLSTCKDFFVGDGIVSNQRLNPTAASHVVVSVLGDIVTVSAVFAVKELKFNQREDHYWKKFVAARLSPSTDST